MGCTNTSAVPSDNQLEYGQTEYKIQAAVRNEGKEQKAESRGQTQDGKGFMRLQKTDCSDFEIIIKTWGSAKIYDFEQNQGQTSTTPVSQSIHSGNPTKNQEENGSLDSVRHEFNKYQPFTHKQGLEQDFPKGDSSGTDTNHPKKSQRSAMANQRPSSSNTLQIDNHNEFAASQSLSFEQIFQPLKQKRLEIQFL